MAYIICILLKMLYTIIGGFVGGCATYFICKLTGVSFDSSSSYIKFPSNGNIIVFLGFIIGASMGFGYGTSQFIAGNHMLNDML